MRKKAVSITIGCSVGEFRWSGSSVLLYYYRWKLWVPCMF